MTAAAAAIADRRRDLGLGGLERRDELDAAAELLAADPLTIRLDPETSMVRLRSALGSRVERWGTLWMGIQRVDEPAQILAPSAAAVEQQTAFGVAVSRAPLTGWPELQIVWVFSERAPRRRR